MGLRHAAAAIAIWLASVSTAGGQTPSYPPPDHMMIFADQAADRLEYFRKLAAREGRTAEAVTLTWQLSERINVVWGPHQSIQWTVYMDIVELWRGAAEHDKAIAVLNRMNDDLAASFWFDNYEHANIRLTQARIHLDNARPDRAEGAFRQYFDLYADSDQPDGPVSAQTYRVFADVLERNGKLPEADEYRRRALRADGTESR